MKIKIMCFDSDLIRRTQGIIIFRKVSLLIKWTFYNTGLLHFQLAKYDHFYKFWSSKIFKIVIEIRNIMISLNMKIWAY